MADFQLTPRRSWDTILFYKLEADQDRHQEKLKVPRKLYHKADLWIIPFALN